MIKRTKLGGIFYDLTYILGKKLFNHKALYYILMFTWGLSLTIIGFLILLICLIISGFKKPKIYHGIICLQIGKSWGGLSCGMVCITGKESYINVIDHELGHTFQNCIYGPFMIFLIAIPSVIRYWYIRLSKKTYYYYDAVWFEGSATLLGENKVFYDNVSNELDNIEKVN